MKREVQGVLLIIVGGAVVRIVTSGAYINYVKPAMQPYLVVSAAILIALGVFALYDAVRAPKDAHVHDDGHNHGSMNVAWLLLLPVAAVFLIAPGPLGAYTAQREGSTIVAPKEGSLLPDLPPGDPVALPLDSFATRAVWDDGRTLVDRTVELVGFVTPAADDGPWQLTRLSVACCAADTLAIKVQPVGDVPDFPANTWVVVTGTFTPGGGTQSADAVPWINVDRIVTIAQPTEPYL